MLITRFAKENDISLQPTKVSRKRKDTVSSTLSIFFVETTIGRKGDDDAHGEDHWRIPIFLRVMDTVRNQFKQRFGDLEFAKSVDNFCDLSFEGSSLFRDQYSGLFGVDLALFEAKVKLRRRWWKQNRKSVI